MSEKVISVEHLSKKYRLGVIGTGTFRDDLKIWFAKVRGKPNPLAKIGVIDHGNREGDTILALNDISFSIKRGEAVGIIGRNGAGKSTLLKILSQVTSPTSGVVKVKGRIASLLEVGTGFHPELTGRENTYLNGAIMGMTRNEVSRKFDEIVHFSGVEQFIDTPVKRYSSGMYVRLAFAVAAHLDPDILVVDEVLAVGDTEFQKKCMGKMGEVAGEGRTVLFVSHNLGSIISLCPTAILLENGKVAVQANSREVVFQYVNSAQINKNLDHKNFFGTITSVLEFKEIFINDSADNKQVIFPSDPIRIRVRGFCKNDLPFFQVTFSIFSEGVRLFTMHDVAKPTLLSSGEFESEVEIPARFLRPGYYSLAIGGESKATSDWIWGTDIAMFQVCEEWSHGYEENKIGLVNLGQSGKREQSLSRSYY